MKLIALIGLFSALLLANLTQAQQTDFSHQRWNAFWIDVPGQSPDAFGVYRFRKSVMLATVPTSFPVHVSADNRYKLFVNGTWVGNGPARSDLYHWNYETVDLAPHLKAGENKIEAVVWNFGADTPEAQISFRTAFILQGTDSSEEVINTNKSWTCVRDDRYSPLKPDLIYTYYVAGPGEKVDYSATTPSSTWTSARELWRGVPKGVFDWSAGWMLVPRTTPAMELRPERLQSVRKAEGVQVEKSFPASSGKLEVQAGKKVLLWLDRGELTNAYLVVKFTDGKNAEIKISYAEALYEIGSGSDWKAQRRKGNRNVIEGKRFVGVTDHLSADGKSNTYTTLHWRTYRYIQLEIETHDEPLLIEDIYGIFTGYPFQQKSELSTNQPMLSKIYETGWRTARLCAVETYMDCPYYEQLQYIGDTRIQALVSLFNSGDDRLMRQAIDQLDNSRIAEGITLSRFPSTTPQQIPTFSLWWIGMIHDFRKYRDDDEYVKSKLPGIRQVLGFFERYQQKNGSLKNSPYWLFTDWSEGPGWDRGVGPIGSDGSSAILDLQLCWAYQLAAELETALGMNGYATLYEEKAKQLKTTIISQYWDSSRKLFSDTSEKKTYSQHTSTLAILANVTQGDPASDLMEKTLADTSLTQATIYFKYYVHRALLKTGHGNRYLDLLQDWKDQINNGLTTWAEISDYTNARSDCHAWGASPNIGFFNIVLGIDSDSTGFGSVKVEPHLGKLTSAKGKIPHPSGEIAVSYSMVKKKWNADIQLPPGVEGTFIWKKKSYALRAGSNTFDGLP